MQLSERSQMDTCALTSHDSLYGKCKKRHKDRYVHCQEPRGVGGGTRQLSKVMGMFQTLMDLGYCCMLKFLIWTQNVRCFSICNRYLIQHDLKHQVFQVMGNNNNNSNRVSNVVTPGEKQEQQLCIDTCFSSCLLFSLSRYHLPLHHPGRRHLSASSSHDPHPQFIVHTPADLRFWIISLPCINSLQFLLITSPQDLCTGWSQCLELSFSGLSRIYFVL